MLSEMCHSPLLTLLCNPGDETDNRLKSMPINRLMMEIDHQSIGGNFVTFAGIDCYRFPISIDELPSTDIDFSFLNHKYPAVSCGVWGVYKFGTDAHKCSAMKIRLQNSHSRVSSEISCHVDNSRKSDIENGAVLIVVQSFRMSMVAFMTSLLAS